MNNFPLRDEDHLEELLSEPSPGAVAAMGRLEGDIIFLGVGGKMGPTLARMAVRASKAAGVHRRVVGVARFSEAGLEEKLRKHGVDTIKCDLLDPAQVAKLPEIPNVVAMTGKKFGGGGQEATVWAMNAYVPALVCERYRKSRIVAFSTGNVYGLAPVRGGGSVETDAPQPKGEYSQSALARERMYEYFCRTHGIPMALVRLNYATEMRYGVLVDVAHKVRMGQSVDVTMGFLNSLWQGDANAMTLCCFDHVNCPPFVINLAGPELLSVRRVAEELGRLMGKNVRIQGEEADDAYLSNAQMSQRIFGYPRVSVQQMLHWIADWVRRGGSSLGKPTHFEVRDGKY